jgi:RNA polymerase sigma-70 factor (ECF subfamily)
VSTGGTGEWPPQSAADVDGEQRLSALLSAHGAALARLARSYVRNDGDGDDLLQDIVVAIWRALPRFRGECSERTFLFRIAHNRAIAYITRRRVPVVDIAGDVEVEDTRPNPEETLSIDQQGRRLLEAVQRLPVNHRQVVTLVLEGLSYAEIADVLGISETNVGARLTRARQMLRQLL